MKENPYAPPTAVVADVAEELRDQSNPLFAVGTVKLAVMSLCTLGLYQFYWLYRHWRLIRGRDRSDISPFWRAFFGVFFCWPLFNRMREDGNAYGVQADFPAGALAFGFFLTNVTWRLPDPWWLIGMLSTVIVVFVQRHANRVNAAAAPGHDRNEQLMGWNWVAVILGGAVLLLAMVGVMLPEVE